MTRNYLRFSCVMKLTIGNISLKTKLQLINERREKRVPNRFSGSEIGLFYSPGSGNLT